MHDKIQQYINIIEDKTNRSGSIAFLELANLKLTNADIEPLMTALKRNPNKASEVLYINLSNNNLTSINIPYTLTHTKVIDLYNNPLTQATMIALGVMEVQIGHRTVLMNSCIRTPLTKEILDQHFQTLMPNLMTSKMKNKDVANNMLGYFERVCARPLMAKNLPGDVIIKIGEYIAPTCIFGQELAIAGMNNFEEIFNNLRFSRAKFTPNFTRDQYITNFSTSKITFNIYKDELEKRIKNNQGCYFSSFTSLENAVAKTATNIPLATSSAIANHGFSKSPLLFSNIKTDSEMKKILLKCLYLIKIKTGFPSLRAILNRVKDFDNKIIAEQQRIISDVIYICKERGFAKYTPDILKAAEKENSLKFKI